VVACFCLACFIARSVLLPIMEDHFGASAAVYSVYFIVSEIIPLSLMLRVFDTKAASGTHTRATLGPLLLGSRASESDYAYANYTQT